MEEAIVVGAENSATYTNGVPNAPIPAPEENIAINKLSPADAMTGKLAQLCEQMDAKGLMKFLLDNRKSFASISDDLPLALRGACEPVHLVLNALEALHFDNQFQSSQKAKFLHRTCLLLMESASPILEMAERGCDNHLSPEIKDRAKVLADEWNAKLAEVDLDASNGYSLETLAFLELLATFNISSEFDEDELCKFLVAVSSHQRKAPALCRALGLADKTQDVIGAVVSKGRQIDAVYFSHVFQLTEIFPPVPLLKQHLEDMKKTIDKANTAGTERKCNLRELSALKAVVKCIVDCKLQEEQLIDSLLVRISQIKKAEADRKRMTGVRRKRRRVKGKYTSKRTPITVENRLKTPTVYDERARCYTDGVRHPYAFAAASPAYEVSGHVPYSRHLQTIAPPPWPHHHPHERVPPFYIASSNYGNYISPAAQSTPWNYGNYMSSGRQRPNSSNHGSCMGRSFPPSYQSFM